MSNSLRPHGLYRPWNSPSQNTGVGSLSLLQGSFPTQGLNPGLTHCRHILYQVSHKASPRIPEWVAFPFSSGYSWPRNWTGVSCIAGRFFTTEPQRKPIICQNKLYFVICKNSIKVRYLRVCFSKNKQTNKKYRKRLWHGAQIPEQPQRGRSTEN